MNIRPLDFGGKHGAILLPLQAQPAKSRWTLMDLCTTYVGKDAILVLCPEEVKKLRENYEKKMQELKK